MLVAYTGERPNDSGKDWTGSYREIDIQDANVFNVLHISVILLRLPGHGVEWTRGLPLRQQLRQSQEGDDLKALDGGDEQVPEVAAVARREVSASGSDGGAKQRPVLLLQGHRKVE